MEQTDLAIAGGNSESDFSSVLNGILSNPEMLSMISSMASTLKGENASAAPTQEKEAEAAAPVLPADIGEKIPSVLSAIAPLLSSSTSSASSHDNNRACLLRALKPYLSSGRSEAIDYIIQFSRISDVLKNLS